MRNQQGSTTILFILIMASVGFFIIYWGYHKMFIYLKHKTLNQHTICSLDYMKTTNGLIERINKIDKLIAIGKKASLIAFLINFPISGLSKLSIAKLIELLKKMQQVLFLNYIKDITKLKLEKCKFDLSILKTPFKHQAFILKRKKHQTISNKEFKTNLSSLYYRFKFHLTKQGKINVQFHKKSKWNNFIRYFNNDDDFNPIHLSSH